MISITIDRAHDEPVYAQVAHQLRRLIASGELTPGTRLPSVRRLASDLGVNLNTIARAYRLLEEEGFLLIRGRSGVKVAAPAEGSEGASHEALMEELHATLARLRQAGLTAAEMLTVVEKEIRAMHGHGREGSHE